MSNYTQILNQSALRRMFDYRDGALIWRHDPNKTKTWNLCHAGRRAGSKPGRYRVVTFRPSQSSPFEKMTPVGVHRMIFCYHHGYYPEYVDHINGDTGDNRIENLRPANAEENSANAKTYSTNKTGHKGVALLVTGKYRAKFFFRKKRYNVGNFDSFSDACAAYDHAVAEVKGRWQRSA